MITEENLYKNYEEDEMEQDQSNIILEENQSSEEEEEEEDEKKDFRLICGINYYKLYKSEIKKYSLLTRDIGIFLLDWQKIEEKKEHLYSSYKDFYTQSNNLSLEEIDDKIYEIEEEQIINPLNDLIKKYNIKHIYIYGCNSIFRRLFKNFTDVKVYNIKEILTSCTPDPIDMAKYNNANYPRIFNANPNYFIDINKWVSKIARVLVMGYDAEELKLNWEKINGEEKVQDFIGAKKILVEIENYIPAQKLCIMNLFSLLLLRQILESEISKNFSDISRKAKDIIFLLKVIYLCISKPNYFQWLKFENDNCQFHILGPDEQFLINYNSRCYLDEIPENLDDFISCQLASEGKKNNFINYKNNNLYDNLISFMNCCQIGYNLIL